MEYTLRSSVANSDRTRQVLSLNMHIFSLNCKYYRGVSDDDELNWFDTCLQQM